MSPQFTSRTIVFAFALSLSTVLQERKAWADDAEDLAALLGNTVVTGASKVSEVSADAPSTTVVITAEQMRTHGIRSLDEAIDYLGRGLITQNPLHTPEVGGRGVLITSDFGDHILLVVDGHAMNEQWGGTAYYDQGLGIPIELIDHIELVLGPGSVLYGSNAMLGVINIVTKRAKDYRGVHIVAESGFSPAQGKGGSFTGLSLNSLGTFERVGLGYGGQFHLLGVPVDVIAQAEYYRQNGPSFEFGPQTYTNPDGTVGNFGPRTPPGVWGGRTLNQYNATVPTFYGKASAGDFSFALKATTFKRRTPYLNSGNQSVSDFDEPGTYELDRWLSGDLQYHRSVSAVTVVDVRAYGDTYDYQMPSISSDPYYCSIFNTRGCTTRYLGASRWTGLEPRVSFDWFKDGALTTILGADARVRWVGTKTDTIDTASGTNLGSVGAFNSTEVVYAAYLQQRWSPSDTWHFNGGVRFDHDTRGGNHLSPRVAGVWNPWTGGAVKLMYAEAFRAPNIYEAYFTAMGSDANPALKPEVVRSVESTLEQRFGQQRIAFGVFRSWWSDMIQLVLTDNGNYQFQNASSIEAYGFDGAFEGQSGDFRYGANLTGAYARRKSDLADEKLPVAPQMHGNARVSWDVPGNWPTVALAGRIVGSRLADRALDGGFPVIPIAPPQVGLRLSISDNVPGAKQWFWRLAGDYVSSSRSAYVAGPNQYVDPADTNRPQAELVPVNRLTGFITIGYNSAD